MTNAMLAGLDQTELFQLARNASDDNEHGKAIAYLKEAVERTDATAHARYLLGAEYAQSKLYTRATGELEAALALDPGLHIARLQLGMLWLSMGESARGTEVLSALLELPEQEPLRLFGDGLIQLAENQLPAALRALTQGIARNSANQALNKGMQQVVAGIEETGVMLQGDETLPKDDDAQHHLLLSAYMQNHGQ